MAWWEWWFWVLEVQLRNWFEARWTWFFFIFCQFFFIAYLIIFQSFAMPPAENWRKAFGHLALKPISPWHFQKKPKIQVTTRSVTNLYSLYHDMKNLKKKYYYYYASIYLFFVIFNVIFLCQFWKKVNF